MKKLIFLLSSLILCLSASSQTTLTQGDLAFLGYNAIGSNTGAPNYIALLVRKPIESGTTIYLTNQNWNSSTSNFNTPISGGKQGTIRLIFDEPASIGQIIEIQFSTASSSLKSTVGSISYTEGSKFDFDPGSDYDQVYVYQSNAGYTFISGMSWSNTAPTSGVPPNMVFASGATQNAFFNGTNGNNLKCGVWTPLSSSSNIAFSSSLSTSFYDKARWEFVTSNSVTTSGYCPCNPDSVHANITNNLYTIIESNMTFDRYLYNKLGNWRQWNGSSWVALSVGPDWSTNTRSKEVIINKNLTIGSTNSNALFECAKLTIQDTSGGDDGVTLTVQSGNSLKIHQGLSFIDNGTLKPSIYLKSSHSGGQTYYATIDPTSANLNDADGNFKYDLHIQYPGWHHFQSPISTQFNAITSSSTFQFKDGAVGTGNTFSWDASTSQWASISLTDDFSTQPYTVLFEASEVPCVLTITGTLSNPDQDAVANLTANYHNPTSNGNVPGWTTDGDDGWNFYGNPYLSPLATEDLLSIFSTNGNGASNKMTGLDNKVYIWQPGSTVTNLTSDYKLKSYLSGTHGGDATATYLAPFQAFFMRRSSGNTNTVGFVKSKKYRKTVSLTSSNSIVNKTSQSHAQFTLSLAKQSTGQSSSIYAVPLGKNRFIDLTSDILSSSNSNTKFGLAYNANLFALKFWPIQTDDTSSIEVLVSHDVNNELFSLSSEPSNTLLLDKLTGTIHDFRSGEYTFSHSTSYNFSPRFVWIFNPQTGLSNSEFSQEEPVGISISNGAVTFTFKKDLDLTILDLSGRIIEQNSFKSGQFVWSFTDRPSGVYLISTSEFSQKFIVP